MANLILNQTENTELDVQLYFFKFIIACVRLLGKWLQAYKSVRRDPLIKDSPATKMEIMAMHWFLYQMSGIEKTSIDDSLEDQGFFAGASAFWKQIVAEMASVDTIPKRKTVNDFYKMAEEEFAKAIACVKNAFEFHEITPDYFKDSCIVFGFDESKVLTTQYLLDEIHSIFHVLRTTFFLVPERGGRTALPMVAVFTDTTSTVSNFSPADPWDNSMRALAKGEKLFPPYCSLYTLDVFAISPPKTLSDLETEFTKYGRPAFHAMAMIVIEFVLS
jgi:hypothetical protein